MGDFIDTTSLYFCRVKTEGSGVVCKSEESMLQIQHDSVETTGSCRRIQQPDTWRLQGERFKMFPEVEVLRILYSIGFVNRCDKIQYD